MLTLCIQLSLQKATTSDYYGCSKECVKVNDIHFTRVLQLQFENWKSFEVKIGPRDEIMVES